MKHSEQALHNECYNAAAHLEVSLTYIPGVGVLVQQYIDGRASRHEDVV